MMTKQEQIELVESKKEKYLEIRYKKGKYWDETMNALREWYGEARALFNAYIPKGNTILERFNDANNCKIEDLYDDKVIYYPQLKHQVENGRLEALVDYPEEEITEGPAVFISHSSKDKVIIKHFIDDILKKGLNLTDSQIACTSFESTGIAGGDNIPEYIRKNIKGAKTFLAMVSPNYKSSEVCMNEVGAAWAVNKQIIQIVLPGTDFNQLGWLINTDKALKINERDCLDSLEETLCESIGIHTPTAKHWNPCTSDFLTSLQNTTKN